MLDVYVVTHPEATHHLEDRVGGWYDSELTPTGFVHAGLVADVLAKRVKDRAGVLVFTSDLTRTRQAAQAIGERLGREPVSMRELREKSYGEGEGQLDAWFRERFIPPPAIGERMDHDEGLAGAETKLEWVRRVYRGMDQILRAPSRTMIVVTHGGSASLVIVHWLRIPWDALGYASFRVEAGSITHLREDDYFHNRTLVELNDTTHLRRG
ncbi:histidine phosphatase family protein [Actinopolymorpha sp. B9G3]|uniref:histidine phosphatase family protein n=1 Tax=Actinopolymorpha sp. B9G3 TaxID=3158970 RepID=UPI0032D970D1